MQRWFVLLFVFCLVFCTSCTTAAEPEEVTAVSEDSAEIVEESSESGGDIKSEETSEKSKTEPGIAQKEPQERSEIGNEAQEPSEREADAGEKSTVESEGSDSRAGRQFDFLPGNAEKYSFEHIEPMENSFLAGKEVCVLGSSVVNGLASSGSAIGEYLAARMGARVTKEAKDGTTLTDISPSSYVQRMKNNLDPNARFDWLICQLSTNDATYGLPLGEICRSKNLEEFDTSTITGSIEYIIGYARRTWNCRVAFFTGSYYENDAYDAMVRCLLELKDKWNICVINLWDEDYFNSLTEEERSLYISHDIHPTKAGYRDWWGPEIERQLTEYEKTMPHTKFDW